MKKNQPLGVHAKATLFAETNCFKGLHEEILTEMATNARSEDYARGELIFQAHDPCLYFSVVAEGLARVSISSPEGHRLTYLMAVRGEPLNLAGPFSEQPRTISAEAVTNTTVVLLERHYVNQLALDHPLIIMAIINGLGNAVDSAHSRLLDMIGKDVDQRLHRILNTLYLKFGPILAFTSTEISELICTTTESTLRSLAKLRRKGIVATGRRKITILKPAALNPSESETVWL